MSRPRSVRTIPLVALLGVLAVALVGCGNLVSRPIPAPTVRGGSAHLIEIEFADGAVTRGVQRFAVPLDSTLRVVVSSDVADEVHVHGYDRRSFVTAGAITTLEFEANLPGVFDIELEQRRAPLASFEVS